MAVASAPDERHHLLSAQLFSREERELFWREGFVVRRGVLSRADAAALASHYEALFSGAFPTGTYPDEWHWRAGISLPDAVSAAPPSMHARPP